jgi:DNA-binding NarL/FixJ family response regulator
MRAGALGYVLKGAAPGDMIRAIAAVAAGEAIFGTGVARRALAYLTTPRTDKNAFPELRAREREVLGLVAAGQVSSRAEAIVRARSAGLGE